MTAPLRIGILGAGAIGGWFAARLAAQGHRLALVARGSHLAALRASGLRLDDTDGAFHATVAASDDPAALGVQDILFITLKSIAIADLVERATPMIGPATVVVSAMNGVPWWFLDDVEGALRGAVLDTVDPDGRIASAIAPRQVVGCVVHGSCSVPEPGRVHHRSGNRIILGEPAGPVSPRVTQLCETLAAAGFRTEAAPRIRDDIWFKLLGNLNFNPISALLGSTTDRIIDSPDTHALCVAMMHEALGVGERLGISLPIDPAVRIAETRKLGAIKSSMLQDAERGRALEIDAILGAPVEIATRLGIEVPRMSTVLALARLKSALLAGG